MSPAESEPGYLRLYHEGELTRRRQRAYAVLRSCTICPRECRIDRCADEHGFCRTGRNPVISSFGPHFGEEPPLVGRGGSGTIFIARCTMACIFCQNYGISRDGEGLEVSAEQFAEMMLSLQARGCHNINIVTPTHIVPQLIHAVEIACSKGLHLPLIYNSGGYDSLETLRLLDGIIDIYMPDAKYADESVAEALSKAPGYVGIMKAAIQEMHRQVGDLVIFEGIARRGMIIRHLVLPENLAGSDIILPWIADAISHDSYVNIMDQYHWPGPGVPARLPESDPRYAALGRGITRSEYTQALGIARACGLHRGF